MDAKKEQVIYVLTSVEDAKQNLFSVNGAHDMNTVRERLNFSNKNNLYICLTIQCEDFKQFLVRVEAQIGMYKSNDKTCAEKHRYHLHFEDLKNILLYVVIPAIVPTPVEVFFVQII
jgi:hypothetical protein